LLATEAADYLVRKGMPFRQAHDVVGKLLSQADRQNKKWTELPLSELKKLSPVFEDDFSDGLNVEAALAAKSVPGGTARESVRAACEELEKKITKLGAKP
jgi:argininosuccinate lyase